MNGWARPSDHGDTAREDAEARYEAAEEEASWPPETDAPDEEGDSLRMIIFRAEQSQDFNDGVEAVVYIRCMEHREVPTFNRNESRGAECAACEVSRWAMAAIRMLASLQAAHPVEASCADCFGELRELVSAIPQGSAIATHRDPFGRGEE